MANANDIVKLAVDSYKGNTLGNYSVSETQETLRQALIDLNGGSTKLDFRALRSHPEMFTIIEEIITKTTLEGLPETNPLFAFTEQRNVALGDSYKFYVDDNTNFVASQIAEGTQGIRRQRLTGRQPITPDMKLYGIKIYEELNRILAGRVDFNDLINKVSAGFQKKLNDDIFAATRNAFGGLDTPYKQTGSFEIDKLLGLIDHVEAATGLTATVITSKQGARNITKEIGITDTTHNMGKGAASAMEDVYNFGYYTHIGQNPVLAMNNAHAAGTTDLILDNDIYVVATDDKFIKQITEGDTLIINGDMYANADLSQEYLCAQRWGLAVVLASVAGYYDVS